MIKPNLDMSILSATCFRPKNSRKLVADPDELVESQVENQVCDQVCDVDSVMEFVLHCITKTQ